MKPAVFFDRDGVLNKDIGYLFQQADLEWLPGAREAVSFLKEKNYYIFVVTNQSGVARNYYAEQDVKLLHEFMQREFLRLGGQVDAFYYCPHHPDYNGKCTCRKPEAGMLLQAMQDFPIDKKKSFLVGDKVSDIQAAEKAGIKGYLFTGGNLFDFVSKLIDKP